MADINYCHCGRPTRPHCPLCGSVRTYGFARRDRVTRADSTVVQLHVFRCLKCGNVYNDDDWQLRCAAPTLATRRDAADAAAGYRPPEDVLPPDALDKAKQGDISEMFGPEAQKVLERYLKRS